MKPTPLYLPEDFDGLVLAVQMPQWMAKLVYENEGWMEEVARACEQRVQELIAERAA